MLSLTSWYSSSWGISWLISSFSLICLSFSSSSYLSTSLSKSLFISFSLLLICCSSTFWLCIVIYCCWIFPAISIFSSFSSNSPFSSFSTFSSLFNISLSKSLFISFSLLLICCSSTFGLCIVIYCCWIFSVLCPFSIFSSFISFSVTIFSSTSFCCSMFSSLFSISCSSCLISSWTWSLGCELESSCSSFFLRVIYLNLTLFSSGLSSSLVKVISLIYTLGSSFSAISFFCSIISALFCNESLTSSSSFCSCSFIFSCSCSCSLDIFSSLFFK